MVRPDQIDDLTAHRLARDIRKRIEEELRLSWSYKSDCYSRN